MRTKLLLLIFLVLFSLNPVKADPIYGLVTPANSIIGMNASDAVGAGNITELPNGNIVIQVPAWNGNLGAVTCLTPAEYRLGGITISASNSLVGSTAGDEVGDNVVFLGNGNYLVYSPNWDNFATATADVGAVTWVDGSTCLPFNEPGKGAVISASNSLIGATASDQVGTGVTVLTNGNYVVRSPNWDDTSLSITDAGAVTWVNGTNGMAGVVGTANSLTGSTSGDQVGNNGVAALTNGNYVVSSTVWDNTAAGAANAGASTWVSGLTGVPFNAVSVGMTINSSNSLVGSSVDDQIGGSMITLSNGNYVVRSGTWDNAGVVDAGAVTWGNSNGGTVGELSAINSLVGSTALDQIGSGGIIALTGNNNYVVNSPGWDSGGTDHGAVTWGNGTTGTSGVVSSLNSLVGSITSDSVGSGGVITLTNGNYVVVSTGWDDGVSVGDAGAVTWVNGSTGVTFNEMSVGAAVNASNSIIGSSGGDGQSVSAVALTNGNYVARFQMWDNGITANVGAVVWGNGGGGTFGTISASNALIGSTAGDQVGSSGIFTLTNGNYVIRSSVWDYSLTATDAGAVTWGDGWNGTHTGVISAANSLVGSTASDNVGNNEPVQLANGNYVVRATAWDNGSSISAGAVAWANGTGITAGELSSSNAVVGTATNDQVGNVTILTNGNYVITADAWDNGTTTNVGMAMWANGLGGTVGTINATNALIGGTSGDQVSSSSVAALTNGNYVVRSRFWDNGAAGAAGAATWGDGNGGTVGVVTASNSIVGTTSNNLVSGANTIALSNGNYIVVSRTWDDGVNSDVGAVTWGNGSTGTALSVSAANSLVGSTASDQVGVSGIVTLSSGGFLVRSASWNNGVTTDVGAITYSGSAADALLFTNNTGKSVSEDGSTDSYSIVLEDAPSGEVMITLTFGDDISVEGETDGSVTLTFTLLNWDEPQTVDIAAVDDSLVEGGQSATITHSISSTDPGYSILTLSDVTVDITDNDTATIAFESTTGDVQETTTPYTVNAVLSTNPAGGSLESAVSVVVLDTPNTATAADYTLVTTLVDFSAGSMDGETDQIDVTIIDDATEESDESFSLSFGAVTGAVSADSGLHIVTILDLEEMPTSTPETGTPEPTAVELLVNSGFELRTIKPSRPDNWTPKNSTKDRLKCNTDTKMFARSGDCAYRFSGSALERSQLSQPVTNVSGLTQGIILKASVYYKTNAATPKLKFKMVVFYVNAPLPDVTKQIIKTASADGYIQFPLSDYAVESGVVERIKFQFQNRAKSGKIYLDDASLSYTP